MGVYDERIKGVMQSVSDEHATVGGYQKSLELQIEAINDQLFSNNPFFRPRGDERKDLERELESLQFDLSRTKPDLLLDTLSHNYKIINEKARETGRPFLEIASEINKDAIIFLQATDIENQIEKFS